MNYENTLKQLVDLEDEVFIDADASIHKATQERWEFQEALLLWNAEHIIDEAADAITNTLIATYRVIWEIPEENTFFSSEDIVNLTISNAKRNDALQTYRGIYSRKTKTISKEEILNQTSNYVAWVLNHASKIDSNITLSSLVKHSLEKISWRMEMYKPQIDLKEKIKSYDFKWVDFKDISPLLANPEYADFIDKQFKYWTRDADAILWLDARGFLWRNIATKAWKGFVMARKPEKLPWELISTEYEKEYWTDSLSIQVGSIKPGQRVAIVDDLLATWGTAAAAERLIKEAWGLLDWSNFVIELDELSWREKLEWTARSMVQY